MLRNPSNLSTSLTAWEGLFYGRAIGKQNSGSRQHWKEVTSNKITDSHEVMHIIPTNTD